MTANVANFPQLKTKIACTSRAVEGGSAVLSCGHGPGPPGGLNSTVGEVILSTLSRGGTFTSAMPAMLSLLTPGQLAADGLAADPQRGLPRVHARQQVHGDPRLRPGDREAGGRGRGRLRVPGGGQEGGLHHPGAGGAPGGAQQVPGPPSAAG